MALGLNTFAKESKKVDSKIKEVTVFLNSTQIERETSVRLVAGEQTIVLKGLEHSINTNTLRAGSIDGVIINEILYHQEYIVEEETNEFDSEIKDLQRKIKSLSDSIYKIGWRIDDKARKLGVLQQEKNLLLNNPIMQGKSIGDSLDLLINATDFLRTQLNEINEATIEISQEKYYLEQERGGMQTRIGVLQNMLNEKNNKKQPNYYYDNQIHLSIYVEEAQTVDFMVSYLVGSAGWTPTYDIRAGEEDKPIDLIMKAKIFQNTGKDWDNVKLNLSSNNPNTQKQKPTLYPWYLYESVPYTAQYDGVRATTSGVYDSNAAIYSEEEVLESTTADYYGKNAPGTTTSQQLSFKLYSIERPMSIPNDGQYHQVPVTKFELTAKYNHHIVPKMDCNSYLMASIGNWDDVDILNGPANIYFQNTFIGVINLNRRAFADTLRLGMGDDQRIFSERKLMKSGSKKKIIGGNMVKTYSYEITLTNSSDELVELVLEDQLPISQNEKIKIELVDSDGDPAFDYATGKLTWKLKLDPKSKMTIRFTSEVSHPKEMIVVGW